MRNVGVLALQGDFREHLAALGAAGAAARAVRRPEQLAGLDGLVIPGGESTTIRRLLAAYELAEPLRERMATGFPVYGTCAGCILLAREVDGAPAPPLGLMDIGVTRNAYGRQVDSFEMDLSVPVLGAPPLRAVFIRAPRIDWVGPAVDALARLEDGTVVAAREGNLLVTTFHPELTGDARFHRYFLEHVVAGSGNRLAVS
ncbi:MAG TPA: pyridoxal 5'-phosphate synthase glutaminase subunit PdxT [Chloroflexota bacterium]|nr:pyridoxal 5'-phosphate synthase glutaminase subunit PdxT [Chloroflexota bacterium]